MKMVRVKICGLTNLEDALAAAECGADALGFVFASSPRRVDPETVRKITGQMPSFVLSVGVFVDEKTSVVKEIREYCGLDAVQLHGHETEEEAAAIGGRIIKAVRPGCSVAVAKKIFPSATLLLDTYVPGLAGGSGACFDWSLAMEPARQRPVILAGGLNPENVAEAVGTVGPYAVDVASGVEKEPGRKDHDKLESFIQRAKYHA